jgi:lysophospholipase L1-like esterase
MEFVEAHKSGYRVQDVAQRFPVPESVDLAIVELGTNDLAKKTDPTLFQQQYGAYLDSIRAKSPTAQFLCLGVWATPSPTGDAADATISKECEARGGKFLRLSLIYANGISRGPAGVPVFAGTSDITHPNDNGHAEIAKQVLDMITVR